MMHVRLNAAVASHLVGNCWSYLQNYGFEIDQEAEWTFEITSYGKDDITKTLQQQPPAAPGEGQNRSEYLKKKTEQFLENDLANRKEEIASTQAECEQLAQEENTELGDQSLAVENPPVEYVPEPIVEIENDTNASMSNSSNLTHETTTTDFHNVTSKKDADSHHLQTKSDESSSSDENHSQPGEGSATRVRTSIQEHIGLESTDPISLQIDTKSEQTVADHDAESKKNNICPVCFEQCNPGDRDAVAAFECGHVMHFKCVVGILTHAYKDENYGTVMARDLERVATKDIKEEQLRVDDATGLPYNIYAWFHTRINIVGDESQICGDRVNEFWREFLAAFERNRNNKDIEESIKMRAEESFKTVIKFLSGKIPGQSLPSKESSDQFRCWCRQAPVIYFENEVLDPHRQIDFLKRVLNNLAEFESFLEASHTLVPARARFFCLLTACLLRFWHTAVDFGIGQKHDDGSDKKITDLSKIEALVKIIMKYDIDGDIVIKGDDSTLLMQGSFCLPLLTTLLKKGVKSINSKNQKGETVLHKLLMEGRHNRGDGIYNQIDLLVKHGADVKVANKYTETPLLFASKYGYTRIVRLFANNGALVNDVNHYKETPLWIAVKHGHIDAVSILLEKGALIDGPEQINGRRVIGNGRIHDPKSNNHVVLPTPVMQAVKEGNVGMASLLATRGARLEYQFTSGKTVLHYAFGSDRKPIDPQTTLEFFEKLLDASSDPKLLVNIADDKTQTPLMMAADNGLENVVVLLLDAGANPVAETKTGKTALVKAVDKGWDKVVAQLLTKMQEKDILKTNSRKQTILSQAVGSDTLSEDKVLAVIQQFQPQDLSNLIIMKDKHDWTPLMSAVARSRVKVVSFLLDAGADRSEIDQNDSTVLHYAIGFGKAEDAIIKMCEALLVNAAPGFLNMQNSKHKTAFMLAVDKGFDRVARFLSEHGADVDIRSKELLQRREEDQLARKVRQDQQVGTKQQQNNVSNHVVEPNHELVSKAQSGTEDQKSDKYEGDLEPADLKSFNPMFKQHFMISKITEHALATKLNSIAVGDSSFIQYSQYDFSTDESPMVSTRVGEAIYMRRFKVKCSWQDTISVSGGEHSSSVQPKFRRCEVQWEGFLPGHGEHRSNADEKGSFYLGAGQMKAWSKFLRRVHSDQEQDVTSFIQGAEDFNSELIGIKLSGNNDQIGFHFDPRNSFLSQPFQAISTTPGAERSWSTDYQLYHFGIEPPTEFVIFLISIHVLLVFATIIYVLWRRRMAVVRSEVSQASQICLPHKRKVARVTLHKISRWFAFLYYAWFAVVMCSLIASLFYAPFEAHSNGHRTSFMCLVALIMAETLVAAFCIRSSRIGADGGRVLTLGIVAAEGLADATIVLLREQRRDPASRDSVTSQDGTDVGECLSQGSTKDPGQKPELESVTDVMSEVTISKEPEPRNYQSRNGEYQQQTNATNDCNSPLTEFDLKQEGMASMSIMVPSFANRVNVNTLPEAIRNVPRPTATLPEQTEASTTHEAQRVSIETEVRRSSVISPQARRKRSSSQSIVFSTSRNCLRKRSSSASVQLPFGLRRPSVSLSDFRDDDSSSVHSSSCCSEIHETIIPMYDAGPDDVIDVIDEIFSSGQDIADIASEDGSSSFNIRNLSSMPPPVVSTPTVAQLLRSFASVPGQFGMRSTVTMASTSRIWQKNVGAKAKHSHEDVCSIIVEPPTTHSIGDLYLPLHSVPDCDNDDVSWSFFTLDGVRFFWANESRRFAAAYFYKDAICNSFRRWNAKGLRNGDVKVRRLLAGMNHDSINAQGQNDHVSSRQFKHNLYPTVAAQVDWCAREVFLRSPIQFLLVCSSFLIPYWSFSVTTISAFALSLFYMVALGVFLVVGLWPTFSAVQCRWSFYADKLWWSKRTFVVQVYRNGHWTYLKPTDLVPGDIFCVPVDMELPCDAVVLSGAPVVDESSLHSTSSAVYNYSDVAKKPLWDVEPSLRCPGAAFHQPCVSHVSHENRLYDGSVVVRIIADDNSTNASPMATATAVCTDVGTRTRRGQLAEAVLKSSLDLSDRRSQFLDHGLMTFLCILIATVLCTSITHILGAWFNGVIALNQNLVSSQLVRVVVPLFGIAEKLLFVDLYLLLTGFVIFLCMVLVTRQVFTWRLQRTGTKVMRTKALSSAGFVDTVVVTQPDLLLHPDQNLRLNMIMPIYHGKAHLDPELTHDHIVVQRKLAKKNPSLQVSSRLKELSESVVDLDFLGAAVGCCHQYSGSVGFTGGTASMHKAVDKAIYEAGGWRILSKNDETAANFATKPRSSYYLSPVAHVRQAPLEIVRFFHSDAHNPTSGCIVRCPESSKMYVIMKGPVDRMIGIADPTSVPLNISETVGKLSESRMHVVAFGFRMIDEYSKNRLPKAPRKEIEMDITLLGFFVFKHFGDHEEAAPEALQCLHEASIHTCLVSGNMDFHGDLALALRAGFLHRPDDLSSKWIIAEHAKEDESDSGSPCSSAPSEIPSHISDATINSFPLIGPEPEDEEPQPEQESPEESSLVDQIAGWQHAGLLDTIMEEDEDAESTLDSSGRVPETSTRQDEDSSSNVHRSTIVSTNSRLDGSCQGNGLQWRDVQTGDILSMKDVLRLDPFRTHVFMQADVFRRLQRADAQFKVPAPRSKKGGLFDRLLPMLRIVWGADHKVKGEVVCSFKRSGHVVAVCGQGFEDSLALASANVSVAGRSEKVDGAWTFISGFICSKDELPLACLVNVLRYGGGCLASLRAIVLMGTVMSIVHAISRCVINVLAPQYGINSPCVFSSQIIVLYAAVSGVALVFRVSDPWEILSMRSRRVFSPSIFGWVITQVIVGIVGLVLILFVGLSAFSLPSEQIVNQQNHSLNQLGYPYYYETQEAGLILIWSLWFLTTTVVSTKIMSLEKASHVFSLQFVFFGSVVLFIWCCLLLLIWGGPSSYTCLAGINCDNNSSWEHFNRCLFGPQLPEIQTQLGDNFLVPTTSNDCRYYNTFPLAQEQLETISFTTFFSKKTCEAPHNCIPDSTRIIATVVLFSMSFLSILISVVLFSRGDKGVPTSTKKK